MRRALFLVALLIGVASTAGLASAAWQAAGSGSGGAKAKSDWRAPTVDGATIVQTSAEDTPRFLAAGASYHVYANILDAGNPSSGVAAVSANVSAITTGANAVALTPCASGCTAGGTTYAYKSAALTADSPLSQGSKSYSISATDNAGNGGSNPGFSVTVDNTAPTTSAAVAPATNASGWNKTSITVTLAAADAGGAGTRSISYGASGAQTIATTTATGSSTAFAITAEGATSLSFRASDNVGNVEAPKTRIVKIDKTPPAVVGAAVVNTATNSAGILKQGGGYVIYANVDEAMSGIAQLTADASAITTGASAVALAPCASGCTAGGTSYAYSTAPQTADSPLGEGGKSYSIGATDNADNAVTQGGFSVSIDNTPPAVTLTAPSAAALTNNPRPAFGGAAGTATDDLGTVTVEIHTGSTVSGPVVQTLSAAAAADSWSATPAANLGDGTYTAQALQSDRAGNTGAPAPVTFTVDTTPPAAPTSASLANGGGQGGAYINGANKANLSVSVALPSTSSASDVVTVTVSDGSRSVSKSAAATAGAGTVTLTGIDASSLGDGTITFTATSTDLAANASPATGSTSPKDTAAPGAPTASYVDNKSPAADAVTGTAQSGATVRATQTAPTASGPYTTTSGGSYTVTVSAAKGVTVTYVVTATDAAGNTSAQTTLTAAATR